MEFKEFIESFVKRMERVGVKVELVGNYPWIYIDRINGKKVTERYLGNHGFTLCFLPLRDQKTEFTDITEIFKLIRKYR